MTDYEIEFGSITEQTDVRTDRVTSVEIEVHVRRNEAERGVAEPQSGDYVVTFDVDDGWATFREVESETAYDDLALVAIRAAADELADIQERYEVESPLQVIQRREYTRHDQLP